MVAWIDKEPATSTETETFMSDVPLAYQDGLVVRGRGLLGHLLEASHWERLMFLTEKDIQSQFQKNLKFANKIDIATAWATSGKALEALENAVRKQKRPKVRPRCHCENFRQRH